MRYDICGNSCIKVLSIIMFLWSVLLSAGCNRGHGPQQAHGTPEVSFVTIHPEKVELETKLPGRISAFRTADIRPRVSGLILERLFTEGSDVSAGQVLYQIDPAPFRATLNNAKAALARAEAVLPSVQSRAERFKALLADNAISRQDYDDAVSALNQAQADISYWKAQLTLARINLDYTKITAPISGRIGPSNVTEGAIVTAYQPLPLATIQQLDPVYVDVPQSTVELSRLSRHIEKGKLSHGAANHNKVRLILEDGTLYPLEGTLQFRDITVDPSTGSVTLRLVFPNPDGVLLPGMFVRTLIKEGVQEQAILVPQQGVLRTPKGDPYAMVINAEGKASMRMLVLDRAIGDKWLVASGLGSGDRVIVEGLQFLRPGMPVKATPFQAGGAAGKQPAPEKRSNQGREPAEGGI